MSSRWCIFLGAGFLAGILCSSHFASWAAGQVPAKQEEPLNVRYARAFLELAKLDLQKAQNANRSVAGTLSAAYIEPLMQGVRMAEQLVDDAQQEAQGKKVAVSLRNEEVHAKLTEISYQKAAAANARVSGTVNGIELERLRLTAEVARLGLERAKVASQTELGFVQWQLDQLHEELFRLRNTVAQISRMN